MQNLVSLHLSVQDLADLDGAIDAMRRVRTPLIALHPAQRRELNKKGDNPEEFCAQTLTVQAANPQTVPSNLGLAETQADLPSQSLRPGSRVETAL